MVLATARGESAAKGMSFLVVYTEISSSFAAKLTVLQRLLTAVKINCVGIKMFSYRDQKKDS